MSDYDCTQEVTDHKRRIRYWMDDVAEQLRNRARYHDVTKLGGVEKPIFDRWTPKLQVFKFGSMEYKQALAAMGEGLAHHYRENRHHPEHFENGVNGMTIVDLIEMVCDWMAAAEAKNVPVNLSYLSERFNLSPQLVEIITNTLRENDFWNAVNGVPVVNFSELPPKSDSMEES